MLVGSRYSGQRGNGPFFLHIENLPSKYTWQDLKDLVRQTANHGLWTDMQIFPNGQPGGKGYARVQRKDDAFRLYKFMTENVIENRILRVHLFDISVGTAEAVFIQCNCGGNLQSHSQNYSAYIMQIANQPGWGTLGITAPLPQLPPYSNGPVVTPSTAAVPIDQQLMQLSQSIAATGFNDRELFHRQNMQKLQYERQMHVQQAQYARQQPQLQHPQNRHHQRYATNERGIPVNATQGYVRTEARGIFVSGLNFKARTKDIEKHFKEAGAIVKIDMPKDPKTDKSKGNATIQYASVDEARKAVRMFDKQKFMDMRLTVRLDREATPVSVPLSTNPPNANASASTSASRQVLRTSTGEPTIVNGSQVRPRALEAS